MKSLLGKFSQFFQKGETDGASFTCNICSRPNRVARTALTREDASCAHCGSTVRMRSVVHLLSNGLFGRSMTLDEFPDDKRILGVGMSDWVGYAEPLAMKLGYTNTYYHQEPLLDITDIPDAMENTLDFVISTDVFEHVLYPVSRAFENTCRLLKDSGVFVFTVPFSLDEDTVEHFGQLHDFEVVKKEGDYQLVDTLPDGSQQVFRNLVFHGGPGSTLEMRVFSEKSVRRELENAGFDDVWIAGEAVPEYGIFWDKPWSLPILARKGKVGP